jgi:CBS domain-containing protein
MPGKADWLAYGLPTERESPAVRFIGESLRELPTCRLRDSVEAVEQAIHKSGIGLCAVVSEEGVVLGVCEGESLCRDRALLAEDVMKAGPRTLRPSYSADEAVDILRQSGEQGVLVTSSDGKLLGVFTSPHSFTSPHR